MKITDRKKILRKIDLAHKRIARLRGQAQEALDAEELLRGTEDVAEHRKVKEAVDKFLRAIERAQKVRLVKLGRALAELDTIPLGESQLVEGLDVEEVKL